MAKPNRVSKDLLSDELRQELNDKRNRDELVDWSMIANKPQLADGSWKPPVQEPADLPLTGNEDGDIRLTLGAEKYVFTWSNKNNQWMLIGANDTSVEWSHIQNKPVTFPATAHQHTEADIMGLDKYTKAEVDTKLATKSNNGHTHAYSTLTGIPTTFQPVSHTHKESDIIGLDKYTKAEVDTKLSGKANASHTHTIANVTNLQATLDAKVNKVTGKDLSTNDFTNADKTKLDALSNNATLNYETMSTKVDNHIADTVAHVTSTDKLLWNTVADKSDKSYVDTQLSSKASTSTVTGHTGNATIHITSTERTNWNTAHTHSQIAHAPANAQKNSDITKAEIEAKLIGDVTTHTHSQYATTSQLDTQLATKASTSSVTGHTGNSTIHVTQADKDYWNGKPNITTSPVEPTAPKHGDFWYKEEL